MIFLKNYKKIVACLGWLVLCSVQSSPVEDCDFYFKIPFDLTAFQACRALIEKCPIINSDTDDDRNFDAVCWKKVSRLPICQQYSQFHDAGPSLSQGAHRAYKNYYVYYQSPHQIIDGGSSWWLLTPTGCALHIPANTYDQLPSDALKQFPMIQDAKNLTHANSDFDLTYAMTANGALVLTEKIGYEQCHACEALIYENRHNYFDTQGHLTNVIIDYSQK